MKHGCPCCLTPDHTLANCPWAASLTVLREHGVIDPMQADEVNDRVAARMIQYRVYSGQLTRLCREKGVEIPPEINALNPDSAYEAA